MEDDERYELRVEEVREDIEVLLNEIARENGRSEMKMTAEYLLKIGSSEKSKVSPPSQLHSLEATFQAEQNASHQESLKVAQHILSLAKWNQRLMNNASELQSDILLLVDSFPSSNSDIHAITSSAPVHTTPASSS